MTIPDQDTIIQALTAVQDPELHQDIVSLQMVKDIEIEETKITVTIELTTPACPLRETIENDIREVLLPLDGVEVVALEWTAQVKASVPREDQKVVEGATNLAVALAAAGAKTAIIDADITGPNIPTMFGLPAGLQAENTEGLRPIDKHGVQVVSLGFLLPKGTPVVWRGPMIGSAVRQLLHDVAWEGIEYLIIDLPPGTSDASMSMAQEAPIAGAVIVSTPQDVSLEDAMKAVSMFEKLDVPVFGMVENMSYFVAPDTGVTYDIFGHGGAKKAADELGIDFLGEIPIEPAIREGADRGVPVVVNAQDSDSAKAFTQIAGSVAARISVLQRMNI